MMRSRWASFGPGRVGLTIHPYPTPLDGSTPILFWTTVGKTHEFRTTFAGQCNIRNGSCGCTVLVEGDEHFVAAGHQRVVVEGQGHDATLVDSAGTYICNRGECAEPVE